MIQKKLQYLSISVIFAVLVGSAIIPYGSIAFAQQSQNAASFADLSSKFGIKPNSDNFLNLKMAQLLSSNKPKDIATLAYIWGYPLVNTQRTSNWMTNPNTPPSIGNGPWNTINFGRTLANASFTTVVSPNDDTLYGSAWLNVTSEPVVLKVPAISDRYYSFQLIDAYTNDYAYVGTRATGSNDGTYLITGPYWNGTVPNGMTQIWSPTELVWVVNRIVVKGSADLPNVHAIQDKISLQPLSIFEGKIAAPQSQPATKQMPVPPQPALIPTTGIKIYDQIDQAMVGNPPNPPDPVTLAKFASIGIAPGKTPSKAAATNSTLNAALQAGITEGEKLIDLQVQNLGIVVNGWHIHPIAQSYGNNYLFRAAVAKHELGANYQNEAAYPVTFTDITGANLTGANKYTIHFTQVPPVNAFWSLTLYNNKSLFYNNTINRYSLGTYSEGLKKNTDGSVDIYIQHQTPVKVSNWLPSPNGPFHLLLRTYYPKEQFLNGTWSPPPIQRANTTG